MVILISHTALRRAQGALTEMTLREPGCLVVLYRGFREHPQDFVYPPGKCPFQGRGPHPGEN